MSKELEEIKSIVAIHFGALGFLNHSENEQILKDRDKVLNYLSRFESIDNVNPSEITLRELVSKCILNPNSIVDVYEQDKNEPHYSNRIFTGMAWEMEKHEIGNKKLKYIFSAVAETISESDRVCIEVEDNE